MQWTLLGFVVTLVILCVMEDVSSQNQKARAKA